MDHATPTPRDYAIIFAVLLLLLAATVGAAFVDVSRFLPGHFWGVWISLLIAAAKALLIILYFMHVRHGPTRIMMFAGAGFLWLGILVTLTMSDYVTRNVPSHANPKGEPTYLDPERAAR
jgi:cytochrome c oxidase subunit 4